MLPRDTEFTTAPASESATPKSQASPSDAGLSKALENRLVIEEDPKSGAFIYKTVDRITGEVISQLPREDVLRLKEDPAYRAGSVVAARA